MSDTTPSTPSAPYDPHAVAIAQLLEKYQAWEREFDAQLTVDPSLDDAVKLAFQLIHMGRSFEYHLTRAASGTRMTALQARFAWHLATTHGGMPMVNVEVALGLSSAGVSKMVARMRERGLVTCDVSSSDPRSVIVALTPAGREEWNDIRAKLAAVSAEVKDAVGRRSAHHFAKKASAVTALDERHAWFEVLRNPRWVLS